MVGFFHGTRHELKVSSNWRKTSRGNSAWKLERIVVAALILASLIYIQWIRLSDLSVYSNVVPLDSLVFDTATACDDAAKLIDNSLKSQWKWIDERLASDYPKERVSGGIFLYPRQASLLAAMTRHIVSSLNRPQVTICETGFGSGHSMALFAHAAAVNNRHPIRILSFDKFDRPYQRPMWQHLNETYAQSNQNHFELIAGDSCKTVPATLKQPSVTCDILHGSSLCRSDNIDLVQYSPCGVLLTSTAMTSLTDRAVYFGPKAQWRRLAQRGCITPPVCFEEALLQVDREFVFAKQGSQHQSKFCIAMTTGICQVNKKQDSRASSCSSDIYQLLSNVQLDKLCPQYQVPIPT